MRKILMGFFGASLVFSFIAPAMAAPSDLRVRCFNETRDDDQLTQSFAAETCEDIGDSVPYFSLGRMVSPRDIYNAGGDLECYDKPKAACLACYKKWRQNYKEMLHQMQKNKLISSQNRVWMVNAVDAYLPELKTTCED